MVRVTAVEARFRERVRQERESRKWSQADLAKLLSDKGIKGIYPTTIAKIEGGERAVRIDEAAALAELFDVSLDALLGRRPGVQTNELAFQLRLLRDAARQSSQQVWASMETIREQLEELPAEFEGADMLQELGDHTWRNSLYPAYDALMGLVNLSQELLRREQGRPELPQEALALVNLGQELLRGRPELQEAVMGLLSPSKIFPHLQGKQTEADDEAQS
jgi:transcriptional regulator with XRE-family HTH domain